MSKNLDTKTEIKKKLYKEIEDGRYEEVKSILEEYPYLINYKFSVFIIKIFIYVFYLVERNAFTFSLQNWRR